MREISNRRVNANRCSTEKGEAWMLKKLVVVFVAAWAMAGAVAAQPSADEAAVEAVLSGYRQAVEARDGDPRTAPPEVGGQCPVGHPDPVHHPRDRQRLGHL